MKNLGSHLPKIGRVLRSILILVAVFFIVVFTMVWFAIVAGITFSAPFLTNFFPSKEGLTILMMINILFVIGIPLVAVIISIVRVVWKRKMSKGWKTSLAVLWLVNLISFIGVGGTLAQEFVAEDEVEQLLPLEVSGEMLAISYYEGDEQDYDEFIFGNDHIELPGARVRYSIKKSNDADWHLNQLVSSRGKRTSEARDLAREVQVPLQVNEGHIASPREIPFSALSKWRNQDVVLELMMPAGKLVQIDNDVYHNVLGIKGYDHAKETRIYKMTDSGDLVCQNCEVEEEAQRQGVSPSSGETTSSLSVTEQTYEFAGFNQISLEGPMKITIEYGENYEVKVIGSGQDLAELESEQDAKQLDINLDMDVTTAPVRVFITTPDLSQLELESTDDVLLRGFNLENLNITASGEMELKTDIVIQSLVLEVSEGMEVEFIGEATHINATLTEASRLDTDRGKVQEIVLDVTDASKVKLSAAVKIIEQSIDEESSLRIVD